MKPYVTDMYGARILIGDRVKHFGQRYTAQATATVVGFELDPDSRCDAYRVMVTPDFENLAEYGTKWHADRTELTPF